MSEFILSEKEITNGAGSEDTVPEHLHELIRTLSTLPALLKGPVRCLKIMSAMRGYPGLNKHGRQIYRETSRIYLVGDWITKAGFNCHERIKVIPMQRLLIIIPEENEEHNE